MNWSDRRQQEMEEYFDCFVKGCDRHSFTKRGLDLHIKARHPEAYDKWKWSYHPSVANT
jgi:hypothetical protein